jgi:hypothetical protein
VSSAGIHREGVGRVGRWDGFAPGRRFPLPAANPLLTNLSNKHHQAAR